MAGILSLRVSSESITFSQKVIGLDGGPAVNAKVIVIHRNIDNSEPVITTIGNTGSLGVFSGSAVIPKHWSRVSVATLVLGKEPEVAFAAKTREIDRVPLAHPDITLSAATTLKTRIFGADGQPIPNVRLRVAEIAPDEPGSGPLPNSTPVPVLPDRTWSAVSDSDGRCVIEGVPPGLRFYLTHDDPSISQPYGQMEIYISSKTPISDGDEYELHLVKPGSLSGRILLPDGTPASHVEFNITEPDPYKTSYRAAAWTNEDGWFHFPSVPPSNYRTYIELLPPLEVEWISKELSPVEIGDESPTILPDIKLVKAAEVTAEIVNAVTGETVEAPLIVRLPPGSHEISYLSQRRLPAGYLEGSYTKQVDVKEGERKQIAFKLNPITADYLIIGSVIDEHGAPVPDAAVALFARGWGMSESVKTGPDGKFRIAQSDHLKGGAAIATNGVDSVSERVMAEPGVAITLVLKKAGFAKVRGTILDEAGNPVRKAALRLSHPNLSAGFRPEAIFGKIYQPPIRADATGGFSFDAVWVGFQGYNIKVSAAGFGDEWIGDLAFSAGATKEINLILKSAGESLSGSIVDADGTAVAGAWVNCRGEGGYRQAVTNAKGEFVMEALTKGAVDLEAGKYDDKSSREVSARVQVPCEPVRLVLPAANGIVGGRVVDSKGKPVSGAEVFANLKNRKAVSDENGNFQITGLMSGWFDIEATFESEGNTKTDAKERVRPSMEDIVLTLKSEKPNARPLPEKPIDLIGQPAPDIDIETWFNSPPQPAKAGGKVRILDFWGLECAPCIATMPKIAKFWDKAPQDKLEIIAISGSYHVDEIREFLKRYPEYKFSFAKAKAETTMYFDYDIRYNPVYVVIAKSGKIVSHGSDWERASAAALAELEKE